MLSLVGRGRIARVAAASVGSLCLAICASVTAQTPGEWRYTISTDQSTIPSDMRVNFPTITFSSCRSAEDFASGRAFALQTLASSTERCPSSGFVRTSAALGSGAAEGETLIYVYACDAGKTLSGIANGSVQKARFIVNLESRYSPPVGGVNVVKQTMTAARIGPCKIRPDSDLMQVK